MRCSIINGREEPRSKRFHEFLKASKFKSMLRGTRRRQLHLRGCRSPPHTPRLLNSVHQGQPLSKTQGAPELEEPDVAEHEWNPVAHHFAYSVAFFAALDDFPATRACECRNRRTASVASSTEASPTCRKFRIIGAGNAAAGSASKSNE